MVQNIKPTKMRMIATIEEILNVEIQLPITSARVLSCANLSG
jgi:hypothetical protein